MSLDMFGNVLRASFSLYRATYGKDKEHIACICFSKSDIAITLRKYSHTYSKIKYSKHLFILELKYFLSNVYMRWISL